jgi:hypothetical protein
MGAIVEHLRDIDPIPSSPDPDRIHSKMTDHLPQNPSTLIVSMEGIQIDSTLSYPIITPTFLCPANHLRVVGLESTGMPTL